MQIILFLFYRIIKEPHENKRFQTRQITEYTSDIQGI